MAYVYECHVPMRNLWKGVYFAAKMPLSASEVGRIRFWYEGEMYSISTFSNHLQTPLKDIIITRYGTKQLIGRRRLQDFDLDMIGKFYVCAEWTVPYCNPLHAIHPAYKASPSIILRKFANCTKDFELYCNRWADGRYEKSYDNWYKKHKKEIDKIISVIEARRKPGDQYQNDQSEIAGKLVEMSDQLTDLKKDIYVKLENFNWISDIESAISAVNELHKKLVK